jgi:non-ribosomal peptide synthetase component F
MMAIQMVGGVYCPLSPRDPQQRLYALVKQTQSHLVLIHSLTKATFTDDIVLLEINALLTNKDVESDIDIVRLSNLSDILNSIAYIIFTSGSTGTPKPVSK